MTIKKNDRINNDIQNTTQKKLKIKQHGYYINGNELGCYLCINKFA